MAGQVDIILGSPGSGKSVQADRLSASRRYVHLSSGALLRAHANPAIEDSMQSGQLVESEVVEKLMFDGLSAVAPDLPVLLDGFPRQRDEAKWLEGALERLGRRLGHVILLSVSKEQAQERLAGRRRSDDTPKTEDERWHEYEHQIKVVIDYYHHRHLLVEIDGMGTPEEVMNRIVAAL